MGRRWALPQSVQVIIPPELVRSAQTGELSKSDLEKSPMTQRLDYTAIAPAGIKALGSVYGYIAQSGLPRLLVDLVYLRVSQINGCAYCIDMHSRDLIKEGLAIEKLVLVQAWHEAGDLFDVRERGALAWAETVTRVAETTIPETAFLAASSLFSEKGTGRPDHRDRVDECVQLPRHWISGFAEGRTF
jgi:AhpD family alkylhydroperoxidase